MKTFLVTGGCGFIGSHLANALLKQGSRVRVLDDLSTGKRVNLPDRAELLLGDVADPAIVRQAMAGVDGCFHLAAVASVQRSVEDWLGTHRTNLTGTIAVLDAARDARSGLPVPVVYASSAAVYGDNAQLPLAESAATRPLSAYGADKLGSELHARVASCVHGVPTAGLRFFNVYGPRQDPASPYSGVISIFCDRLRRGQKVTVYGDGQQVRDFVYVGDVVTALTAAMERCSSEPVVANVCSGRPTSVLDLARHVADILGVPFAPNHEPARSGDIRASVGDPSHLHRTLSVEAATPLEVGLRETLDWMQQAGT